MQIKKILTYTVITAVCEDLLCYEDIARVGYIVMVEGIFLSWVPGLFAYGFGELVDKAAEIHKLPEVKEQKKEVRENQ